MGSTNDKGERPATRPVTPKNILATIYHAMGIDTERTFNSVGGRPVPVLPDGEAITELIA